MAVRVTESALKKMLVESAKYKSIVKNLPSTKLTAEKAAALPARERECTICLDGFEADNTIKFLPCFHRFHEECAVHWLQSNHQCPMCKTSVIDEALEKKMKAELMAGNQGVVVCAHCSTRLMYNPAIGNKVCCFHCNGITLVQPTSATAVCPGCQIRLAYNPSLGNTVRCQQCRTVFSAGST
jgi:hypothetical protein